MKKKILTLESISKKYKERVILDKVNLEIFQGELIYIMGKSGSGKSTLLNIISGLDENYDGNIYRNMDNISPISYAIQRPKFLPWRNVYENLRLINELNKHSYKNIEEILSIIKLDAYRNLYPHQLSGGMAQRLSIGQILLSNPELILLDEPFSALDTNSKNELNSIIVEISRKYNIAIVVVTHDEKEANLFADNRYYLDERYFTLNKVNKF